ncbi:MULTISPECIES: allantoicase [unclassified Roseitalea]|uniref:allantoicase n=1 Tax=unclassified Roseitalea TaxID=2639107 RepID=UPI00273D9145|nr:MULTISPECIES: allantoicase [unclassified Roseitalea]
MPTIESLQPDKPLFVRTGINLASAGLGARGIHATDEFFAPLARMLADTPPVFIPDRFDDNGKWMDGWETRRRRDGGHDHCVIALATSGRILGFDVDTAHFTGNYAPAAMVEACLSDGDPDETTNWVTILPHKPLGPSAHHFFACENYETWTHLRVHIFPDGGIARFRAYGVPDLHRDGPSGEIDLAASLNGGRILAYSDAHFGAYERLLAPGRAHNMGDAWETRRRREPGYDWIIVALGARGRITRAIVDTLHFKGNYPDRCSIQAADMRSFGDLLSDALVTDSMFWPTVLDETALSANTEHVFADLADLGSVTHVRFNIYPDGGVSRLRLFGLAD